MICESRLWHRIKQLETKGLTSPFRVYPFPNNPYVEDVTGKWRKMEQKWTKDLDNGNDVEVEILLTYDGSGKTPTVLMGEFKVNNGEPIEFEFDN